MSNPRRKLINIIARALVALLIVALFCLLSVSGFKYEVTYLVQKTLPGLDYAAQGDAIMGENYIRCLNIAGPFGLVDVNETLEKIETTTLQADVYFQKYRETIFDKEDKANFGKVEQLCLAYKEKRAQFFVLIKAHHQDEALHYLKSEVTPVYNDYSISMSKMFKHKVEVGRIRREQVRLLSFMTPIVVGMLYVLLFMLGLLVSIKFMVR